MIILWFVLLHTFINSPIKCAFVEGIFGVAQVIQLDDARFYKCTYAFNIICRVASQDGWMGGGENRPQYS